MEQPHILEFRRPGHQTSFLRFTPDDRAAFMQDIRDGYFRTIAIIRQGGTKYSTGRRKRRGRKKYIGFIKNKSLSVTYIPGKHYVKAI